MGDHHSLTKGQTRSAMCSGQGATRSSGDGDKILDSCHPRFALRHPPSPDWPSRRSQFSELVAVAHSSGAEYLDALRLPYASFGDLPDALGALEAGRSDAVVNSIGALQYLSPRATNAQLKRPGQSSPQLRGFPLPLGSALTNTLDRVLIEILASSNGAGSRSW